MKFSKNRKGKAMALFDCLNKAQKKIDELQKKAETLTAKLESNPKAATEAFLKEKPNPGPTIEDISKQTLKQRDSMKRNGFKEYTFIANSGCCDCCAALNRKHFQIAKLKIGINAPPMHDGCRCSIAAYDDAEDYEAWLDNLSKGGSTADWKKQKKKK